MRSLALYPENWKENESFCEFVRLECDPPVISVTCRLFFSRQIAVSQENGVNGTFGAGTFGAGPVAGRAVAGVAFRHSPGARPPVHHSFLILIPLCIFKGP